MVDLHLSAEQLEFRDGVRDFVAQELKPFAVSPQHLEAAERRLPMEILDKASDLGLRTLALSEELGGAGASNLTFCILAEELAAGDADVATVLTETARLGQLLFDRLMTPAQRDRFLPQFLSDPRFHLAAAQSESEAALGLGINYHRPLPAEVPLRTTARRSGGEWVINGEKKAVANAPVAKLFAVWAQTPEGASAFLVPREASGLSLSARAGNSHLGACGDLVFADCRVPAANLLGLEGSAPHLCAAEKAGRGNPLRQAIALGIGRAAYEAALDYARLRVQGGRRIIEHQAIGTKLADVLVRLEVARAAIWQAAWASDHAEAFADRSLADLPLATIAEVYTGPAIYAAAKDAAECFGAMGVMKDMPLQKYVHDALLSLHSGGGNGEAKLRLAEALAGYVR